MKSGRIYLFLAFFAYLVACRSSEDVLTEVAKSHVEANIPQGKLFDEFLARYLHNYFCKGANDCRVRYEFLRDAPTQSGTSYPKYYLWMEKIQGNAVGEEGAVCVAAMEQHGFSVTHFLSREAILASPQQVASIFPAALVDKITQKARSR